MLTNKNINYNGRSIAAINRDGELWFDAAEAGKGLGFKDDRAANRVLDLYRNFQSEFTSADVGFILDEHFFSASGIWLLAFAANTNKARAFARWVQASN